MENNHQSTTTATATSYTLPWQTPGLKMTPHQQRRPLRERPSESPLPASSANSNSNDSLIWRTRSLDDGGRMRKSSTSPQDDHHHNNSQLEREPEEPQEQEPSHHQDSPLHSSFDAALLDNDFHSIFRVSKRRASASAATFSLGNTSSAIKQELTPQNSSCGRKHLRQASVMRDHPHHQTSGNGSGYRNSNNLFKEEDDEDELACPGTVRKLARHNSNESIKSKGTPARAATAWNTTNNKHNNSNTATKPAWKPPLIHSLKFPLTPTAPSTAMTQPLTNIHSEQTTLDLGASSTTDSPSATPFRFTSFPASLPRVHPPTILRENTHHPHHGGMLPPDSVRKRMFPPHSAASHHNHHIHHATSNAAMPHSQNTQNNTSNHNNNNSREEDGTQNTSISSLSTHGEEDPRMPPVHTRLFLEEEYAYSDDEEEDDDDDDDNMVGRTRLNFNMMLNSPTKVLNNGHHSNKNSDESPFKDLVSGGGDATEKDIMKEDAEEATAPTDLSRPYEQRHVHSFPSTMSSHSPLRNLSGYYDDTSTTGLPGTVPRNYHLAQQQQQQQQQNQQGQLLHSSSTSTALPSTPEEVQMHFQFDAVGCSPIPGIPEEEELRARGGGASSGAPGPLRAKTAMSRLPPKPHAANKASDGTTTTMTTHVPAATKSTCAAGSVKDGEEAARLSFSTAESVASATSSSNTTKLRRLRPMPDMSAFEMDSGSKQSGDDMTGVSSPCSPKQRQPLCPPTPVRTPVWAQPCIGDEDDDDDGPYVNGMGGGGEDQRPRPMLFQKHHRSNSLIMTRVLATCSPQTMDYQAKEEDDHDENNKSNSPGAEGMDSTATTTMDQEMDYVGDNNSKNESREDTTTSGMPQHPEAPPAIRRSVREMGSIVSFETDFEVLGILGKGAFADVYKVRSKFDAKLYAVKRNRRHFRGKRDREIALAEVRSMQRLQQHATSPKEQEKTNKSLQYLLFFYRAWQEDGHFFCQTELCCRDTCRELMDCVSLEWNHAKNKYPSLKRHLPPREGVVAGGPLDVGGRLIPNMTVWKICHDICAGLSHIHSRKIVHNDIKPSNIFFVAHGKLGSLCKIGDLGMAAEIGTSEDGQEGDQKYMAPELLNSALKHSSADIFSLGLTLYEVAAGFGFDLPKQGPRWHELRNGSHVPELPTSRDAALGHLIQQMISPTNTKRPDSDSILKHEMVSSAGSSCDEFLRDYIQDIEEFDRKASVRRGSYAAADHAADDQTPRAGTGGIPCRARVCSPTLGPFSTAAPNIFTPEAT